MRGGSAGFDVHPALQARCARLRAVSDFVGNRFLPQLKAIAQCEGGTICQNPQTDRMTFVDPRTSRRSPGAASARARIRIRRSTASASCFDGKTFAASRWRATEPLTCGVSANEFRAYSPRALDPHRERLLLRRHDIPGRAAGNVAAQRHSRRDVGRGQRGVWRRGASERRKAMPRWRTPHWPRRARARPAERGLGLDRADRPADANAAVARCPPPESGNRRCEITRCLKAYQDT